jgi:glycerate-2-kinase
MIATPLLALEAAAVEARALGLKPVLLGDALQGEARLVGRVLADIARGARLHGHPAPPPCVLLSGGETTVTLPPGVQGGAGGRCTDFALGLAAALDGLPGVWTLAADTDGIDGRAVDAAGAPAAGAIVTPDSLARARARGIDPAATLAGFASAALFDALGDLVVTGPTLTNVNDFRAILIG